MVTWAAADMSHLAYIGINIPSPVDGKGTSLNRSGLHGMCDGSARPRTFIALTLLLALVSTCGSRNGFCCAWKPGVPRHGRRS